jgi:hypothetical protein
VGEWKRRLITELHDAGLVRTPPAQAQQRLVTAAQQLLRNAQGLIWILQGQKGNSDDRRYFIGEDVSRIKLAGLLVNSVAPANVKKISDVLVHFVNDEIDPIRKVDGAIREWEDRLSRLRTMIDELEHQSLP